MHETLASLPKQQGMGAAQGEIYTTADQVKWAVPAAGQR